MPDFIDRDAVQAMMGRAQLVEVLEPDSYRELHLPGALNIPLHELDRRAPFELRTDAPIVAYRHDFA
jgi:rhodanese-related sulfurtransferase